MRSLRQLVFPDGLVVAAGFLVVRLDPLRAAAGGLAASVLVAALLIGGVLSLRFHRGRMVLVLLLLGVAARVLATVANPPTAPERVALALIAILLPLNVAAIALLPERDALSNAGRGRLALIVVEGLLVASVAYSGTDASAAVLERSYIPALAAPWAGVPQLALVTSAAALVLFLVLWIREPSPVARGLFWALVAVVPALGAGGRSPDTMLWLATAGLVLALAVIEASYALAFHDGLTGLPTRRSLAEALHQLGDRYAIAMIDVDHFKQCNDRWGHHVGDQVLRMVAARLERVGGGGRAFRYGGEEFAVLFAGCDAAQARPHLEAVRDAVESSRFAVRHRPRPRRKPRQARARQSKVDGIAVTVSIGVATGGARGAAQAVIEAADRALYRAKEAGRNRVEIEDR